MADDAKTGNINIEDLDLDSLLSRIEEKDSFSRQLQEQEEILRKGYRETENIINQTKLKLDEQKKTFNSQCDILTKIGKKLLEFAEDYGENSEQYLKLQKAAQDLTDANLDLKLQIDETKEYLESVEENTRKTQEAFREAEKEYTRQKVQFSDTMSDVMKQNKKDIDLAIMKLLQAREHSKTDESYQAEEIKANEEYLELKEQQVRLEAIQFEYMTRREQVDAIIRNHKDYERDKKDLDMRRASGDLDEENYIFLLRNLDKKFAGRGMSDAIGIQALEGLTEGKALNQILEEGIQTALSISPVGQAVLTISKYVGKIFSVLNKGVTEAATLSGQYLAKIDSRLQGSILDKNGGYGIYKELIADITDRFSSSPFVSQKKLLENIAKLTDQGIGWNLEQRALIETLSEKMVSTFGVLEGSLDRLIRIQGADLTMPAMGAEAELTKFLNKNFEDTSYLNSLYDSVSTAILDASSQLNYEGAIGFNYAVQKWLSSLYSVGMSDQGVNTLAQGINYLATGNADALSSNASLQNLLALSATNAGLNYADLLKTGLDAEKTDMLLESMVRYLQGIYSNINNNVVKSAWSNIAGLSVTDLRSISNLSQTEINNIANSDINYNSAQSAFNSQLQYVSKRTSVSDYVDNLLDNLLLGFGNSLINAGSVEDGLKTYALWRAGQAIGGTTGTIVQGLSLLSNVFGGVDRRAEYQRNNGYDYNYDHGDRNPRMTAPEGEEIPEYEDNRLDVWDYMVTTANQLFNGSLDLENGFYDSINATLMKQGQNSIKGSYLDSLTLKDRALNYVPLASMILSSDMGQLQSSGTDLGVPVMSAADQAALKAAGEEWNAANAAGDEAGKKAAHAKAEAIRAKYGFSGGSNGAGYIRLSTSSLLGGALGGGALGVAGSTSGFTEGTSFALTSASSSSDRSMSLVNNDLVTAGVSSVTGESFESKTRTIVDLYEKLFERREVPIRVQLAEFEELAVNTLKERLITDLAGDVKYLANQASGSGINVDLGSEDASVLTSQIYNVRRL